MNQAVLHKNHWVFPNDSVLPWQTGLIEDLRFNRFLRHAAGIFLVIALLLPFFSLPDTATPPIAKEREKYTRLIIEEKVIAPAVDVKPLPLPVIKPKRNPSQKRQLSLNLKK